MADRIRISEEERAELATGEAAEFPKYTGQLLNIANQNAQGTRPKVVGSMNEITEEFRRRYPEGNYEEWVDFYYNEYGGEERIKEATERTYDMIQNMSEAMDQIDENMVQEWIEDLVLYKTYQGFDIQEVIFERLAEEYKAEYRASTPEEESKGIDGYIGKQSISIKPITYQQQPQLQEEIQAPIVYYEEYESSNALNLDMTELTEAVDDSE